LLFIRVWARPHQHHAAGDRWDTGLRDRVVAVDAWRPADEVTETRTERTETREADQEADLRDRQVCASQEGLRTLDPASRQVRAGRFAIGHRERADEVEPGVASFAGHRVEVERLRVFAIHEVASTPKRGQQEQRVLGHSALRGARWTFD
jgi:hypothetical protein